MTGAVDPTDAEVERLAARAGVNAGIARAFLLGGGLPTGMRERLESAARHLGLSVGVEPVFGRKCESDWR